MKKTAIVALLAVSSLASIARAEGYLVAVSNERSGDVSLIDGATREVVDTIRVGKRPRGIAASRDGNPCGRTLVNGSFCVVHDRVSCSAAVWRQGVPGRCVARLVDGEAMRCPECGGSVRLQDVLKGGAG